MLEFTVMIDLVSKDFSSLASGLEPFHEMTRPQVDDENFSCQVPPYSISEFTKEALHAAEDTVKKQDPNDIIYSEVRDSIVKDDFRRTSLSKFEDVLNPLVNLASLFRAKKVIQAIENLISKQPYLKSYIKMLQQAPQQVKKVINALLASRYETNLDQIDVAIAGVEGP